MSADPELPCGCPRRRYAARIAGAYRVARCTYAPQCRLGAHEHGEHRVVLTVHGEFESIYERNRFPLGAGQAMFRPAGVRHADAYSAETVCLSIAFSAGGANDYRARAYSDPDLPSFARRLSAELDASDAAAPLATEALCAMLVARMQLDVREERRPDWIRRVRERLEDECFAPPTLSAIAADVDRNASHVATTFRKTYGTTIGTYVRTARTWRLRRLVEDLSIPLADLAQSGGFADQSHFGRVFRATLGLAPGEYRRRG